MVNTVPPFVFTLLAQSLSKRELLPQYICPEKVVFYGILSQLWKFLFFKNLDNNLNLRKSRGLHISPENGNCMIVCFLNYICLLSSFPVLLASSKQLDSAHQHQLDVLLIKSSDKQAWAFSLGKEGAEVCRHLAGSKNNTRMMAQEASQRKIAISGNWLFGFPEFFVQFFKYSLNTLSYALKQIDCHNNHHIYARYQFQASEMRQCWVFEKINKWYFCLHCLQLEQNAR